MSRYTYYVRYWSCQYRWAVNKFWSYWRRHSSNTFIATHSSILLMETIRTTCRFLFNTRRWTSKSGWKTWNTTLEIYSWQPVEIWDYFWAFLAYLCCLFWSSGHWNYLRIKISTQIKICAEILLHKQIKLDAFFKKIWPI